MPIGTNVHGVEVVDVDGTAKSQGRIFITEILQRRALAASKWRCSSLSANVAYLLAWQSRLILRKLKKRATAGLGLVPNSGDLFFA